MQIVMQMSVFRLGRNILIKYCGTGNYDSLAALIYNGTEVETDTVSSK